MCCIPAVPMVYSPDDDEADELMDRNDVMISEEPVKPLSKSNSSAITTESATAEAGPSTEAPVLLRSLFCRMCLKKGLGLIPFNSKLHNANLVDIIFTVTGLRVDIDGDLPTKICADCVGKADLAFNVRMEFLHHERILQNLISSNQLQAHYESYDNHRQETRSLNKVYLNNLMDNIKQEVVSRASLYIYDKNHRRHLTLSIYILQINEEPVMTVDSNGSVTSILKEEMFIDESIPEGTEIEVLEEYEEEHLYDEEDSSLADVHAAEPEVKSQPAASEQRPIPVNVNNKLNNQLNVEVEPDSEEEPEPKPKYVYSWKELYKPKPGIVKKPQYKILEYRPKPKLVPHTCYVCDTANEDADALEVHMEQHVSILPYRCDQCSTEQKPQVLKTLISLNRHLMTHLYAYPCDYCPLRFLTQASYIEHMKSQHEAGDADGFACDYCGQFFRKKRQFYHHLAKHKALEHGE